MENLNNLQYSTCASVSKITLFLYLFLKSHSFVTNQAWMSFYLRAKRSIDTYSKIRTRPESWTQMPVYWAHTKSIDWRNQSREALLRSTSNDRSMKRVLTSHESDNLQRISQTNSRHPLIYGAALSICILITA